MISRRALFGFTIGAAASVSKPVQPSPVDCGKEAAAVLGQPFPEEWKMGPRRTMEEWVALYMPGAKEYKSSDFSRVEPAAEPTSASLTKRGTGPATA